MCLIGTLPGLSVRRSISGIRVLGGISYQRGGRLGLLVVFEGLQLGWGAAVVFVLPFLGVFCLRSGSGGPLCNCPGVLAMSPRLC